MTEFLLSHEPQLRLAVFLFVLVVMVIWETASPCRRQEIPRLIRWSNNLGLVVVDTALLRLTFPVLAVGLASRAEAEGWGLLNLVDLPTWLAVMVTLLVLDLGLYLQHALFHAVPVLWRLHRVHHADLEFDTTTGLRFHPVEILLSMAFKLALVAVLGAPPVAVLLFEIILNATALFNHGNVSLPGGLDRLVRLVMVTPDMHRVHHSSDPVETNSNYGFNLPWWDWLFRTYRAEPRLGQQGMQIGIGRFRTRRDLWLDRMLLQPLRRPAKDDGARDDGAE